MKHYINNIPLETGEITVLMHENAETITRHACKTAQAVRQHNIGVLVINCGVSSRRFNQAADKYITDASRNKRPYLFTTTKEKGNLAAEKRYIDDMLDHGISVLIISGWEWTSDNYRRRAKLLTCLREWAEQKNIAIVIYSQARTEPTPGEYDRGGLGWLASIAYDIRKIDTVEQTVTIPKPPPLIHTEEDRAAAERSAQLIVDMLSTYEGKGRGANGRVDSRESVVGSLITND